MQGWTNTGQRGHVMKGEVGSEGRPKVRAVKDERSLPERFKGTDMSGIRNAV